MARQRRRGNGLFEAFQLLNLQNELIANPPVAPKPELTAQEKRERRERAITEARAADYKKRQEREEAEHAIALENGRRSDMFRAFHATSEERELFARTKPELIPQLLAEERNCKPTPEISALYDRVVLPSLLK